MPSIWASTPPSATSSAIHLVRLSDQSSRPMVSRAAVSRASAVVVWLASRVAPVTRRRTKMASSFSGISPATRNMPRAKPPARSLW